jgi:cytochrome b561
MSETASVSALSAAAARARAGRFDQVSIAFHWAVVLLIASQLTTAWLILQGGDEGANTAAILAFHRLSGLVTWIVATARLAWRRTFAKLPPFPVSMPKLQQTIAKANEYGLYALLLLQPLTGLGDTLFRGKPVSLFVWKLPAVLPTVKPAFHAFHAAHEIGAIALLALLALHVGAALFHAARRDGVLGRMLPWTTP